MATWHIERDDKVKSIDEDLLRSRLRKGRYTGAELVRRDGETQWQRICDLPLYREEVPGGGDPIGAVKTKLVSSLLTHLGIFALVVGVTADHGVPFWAFFWGAGLASHVYRTAMQLRALGPTPIQSTPLPASPAQAAPAQAAPLPVPAPVEAPPAPERSPWRARVEEALVGLESAARRTGRERALPDLAALRRDADALDHDALELHALSNPSLRERLKHELEESERLAAAATDARTAEAHAATALAIRDRLSSAEEAAETSGRLQARQSALLHQVEGLRLSLANARLDDANAPDLAEQIREVRARAEASAELDRQLAAARQVQRAAQAR